MLSERPKVYLAVLMLCLVAFALGVRAKAQDRENTSGSDETGPVPQEDLESLAPLQKPTGGRAERIQNVGPDTYILRDAQGRPQAMPGMTYEDFLAAWKRLQQVDETDRRRLFTIDRVEIAG